MKKSLLFLFFLCLPLFAPAQNAPDFDPQTKYRIVCQAVGTGGVALGSLHNSSAYLYHYQGTDTPDDLWWYIRQDGTAYTLQNAQSLSYITYHSERIENVAKGLVLSESATGSDSRWTFAARDGAWIIANEGQPTQWFNLRMDGTYLLGTYSSNEASSNELFLIYDEAGNLVGQGESPGKADDFTAESGTTSQGEYWERTGLTTPVVATTDTSSPVLYSILNLRRTQYVCATSSGLYQTDTPTERTHFYFVEQGGYMQVFTEDGQCVATQYSSSGSNQPLQLTPTPGSGNLWQISWGETGTTPGYALCRQDNLDNGGQGGGMWDGTNSYRYWNDNNGSFICLYDLDNGSTFVFTSSDARHLDYLKRQGITPGTGGGGGTTVPTGDIAAYCDTLRLNGKELVYDSKSQTYFASLPPGLQDGGTWHTTLTFRPKTTYADYSVQLDGLSPDPADDTIDLTDPTCARTYPLQILDEEGQGVAAARIQFTFLPLVEVNVSQTNGSYYTTGTMRVTDPASAGYDSTVIAAFRYRGASAQNYAKKSYAIKLRDANGESVDRSYFGLRSDNNWILDAMAIDPACMRNRVATDLWNDFSTPPYYHDRESKARTGTRGRFVEVFLNGSYHGLYCMTEKLDRKQLKLKKMADGQVHGLLYKSAEWSYETLMGHEIDSDYFPQHAPRSYSNHLGQETWAGYELKYPDYETEAVDWEPLWNAVNFVATSSQATFDQEVAERFDRPVVDDYYLFIELLLATDNHGKNMFFFTYDKTGDEGERIGIAPWDLDGTWGINYYGNTSYTSDATQEFDSFIWKYEHGQGTLFHKLRQSTTLDWEAALAQRYAELRKEWFKPENLNARVAAYAKLFADSHADEREQRAWSTYHTDLQGAAIYMEEWMEARIAALDEQYGYDESISGINTAKQAAHFKAEGGKGAIGITAGKGTTVRICTPAGRLVRTTKVGKGFTVVDGLTPGVYIVNGAKVLVR